MVSVATVAKSYHSLLSTIQSCKSSDHWTGQMRNKKDREGHCRGVLGECESTKELAPGREAEECAPILRRRFAGH